MYIQAFSASSLPIVSTPYFLVVDTVAVGVDSTKIIVDSEGTRYDS